MPTNWKPVLDPSETGMETAFVIDNTNYIESILKEILVKYISPPKEKLPFLNEIILNNSMLNLGAKVKAFLYLMEKNNWKKIDQNHFHTIFNIRNAFAHCGVSSPNIEVRMNEDGSTTVTDIFYLIESVKSSGKFTKVKRRDALHKFTQSYVAVKDYLHEILKNLEENRA